MKEDVLKCPICLSNNLAFFSEVVDHFGTKEIFTLKKCQVCTTLLTTPKPTSDSITKYYKSASYISHGDSKGGFFDFLYQQIQSINFQKKYNLLRKHTRQIKHLDYGCGTGAFINYLNNKNWETTGIEPDNNARHLAKKHNPSSTITAAINDLDSSQTFTSITLFHVLEHVHAIESTLHSLIERLSNDGILIIALPNYNSHDARYYSQFWAAYDVPRHLYHFSQTSVQHLAKRFGLNIVATHPMIFDSYYASLLSEEYKSGERKYIQSFIHGYRSNLAATKTSEYSSLIYVLTK